MKNSKNNKLVSLIGDGKSVGLQYSELIKPYLGEGLKLFSLNSFKKHGVLSK